MDPEEAKDWLLGIVYPMMDIDGSGELSYEEVRAWVAWVHIPLMEHMEHPPEPPPEEEPLPEGEPPHDGEPPPEGEPGAHCGDFIGNHVEFSLSISTGPTAMAITLPEAREGGCFYLEVTGGDLDTMANEFQIIEETDPPSDPPPVIWHSMQEDAQAIFESMVLGPGIYHVELIDSGVPAAVFTFSYVDYATGGP